MKDKTPLIGAIVLIVLIFGLALWYMLTHPAPIAPAPTPGAVTQADQQLTDHGQYYDAEAVYPGTTPLAATAGADADAKAVAAMKTFAQSTIDTFKQEGNFANLTAEDVKMQGLDQGRKYTIQIAYDATSSPSTLSYVYTVYEDTLGAHPNGYYKTFTFDSKSGANLAIGDLFTPGSNYLNTLSTIARSKLPGMIATMESVSPSEVDRDMLNSGTTPTVDNFQNFYFDGTGTLVLIFPPYQVGPYVLGAVTLPIPTSQLKNILKPEYQ